VDGSLIEEVPEYPPWSSLLTFTQNTLVLKASVARWNDRTPLMQILKMGLN